MADWLITLYSFHSVFVYGVVKLSFTYKFFSICLEKHDIHEQLMRKAESERFHVLASRLPSLNDCVVT